MRELLENVIWESLTGSHAKHAVGNGAARRYAQGFSPIAAFANAENPDFSALAPYCQPGEQIYCDRWRGTDTVVVRRYDRPASDDGRGVDRLRAQGGGPGRRAARPPEISLIAGKICRKIPARLKISVVHQ